MPSKQAVYLCIITMPGNDKTIFFNCMDHFIKARDSVRKKGLGTIEKITDVPHESCIHCLGNQFEEVSANSRNRAVGLHAWLLASDENPTKDQVL